MIFNSASVFLTMTLGIQGLQSPAAYAAEKKPRPPAYLTPEDAGLDYKLQGEYRGWQRPLGSARSSQSIGLQVIANGEDQFTATKYYGGLPGSGWIRGERFNYTGRKYGDLVRLQSKDYQIEVDGESALIYTPNGMLIGELKKVERVSPTMGAVPPPGAIVLFDGTENSGFTKPNITPEGLLREGTQTAEPFGDFRLHAEFMLPFKPLGRGQDRGNSGFYLQGRYEVQVLDSFGLEGIENECGSLYRTRRPDVNMALPPLSWQTYDIDFRPAKFDAAGKKISDMKITIWHNGVLIHNQAAIPNKTGGGTVEGPEPLPTKLQDHQNPVLYRNIWIIPTDGNTANDSSWVKLPTQSPPIPVRTFAPGGIVNVSPGGLVMLTSPQ
ncbi:3-keto-disaccharide hydrolase [Planctomicrobium sp. SH527]|uniref:3-keto-disaccharide hydrolase n=1 Tax=Planctomicrobium sp. SH527 TaxID=3448123 RepID=UPI003F5BFA4C